MEPEKKILIGINLNFETPFILSSAVSFFRESAARFYVMHVVVANPNYSLIKNKSEQIEDKKHEAFNDIEKILKEGGLYYLKSEIVVSAGVPYAEILNFARKNAVEMIVIGTHQKIGLKELISGSTSYSVAKNSNCPVLLIPLKNTARVNETELAEERAISFIKPA